MPLYRYLASDKRGTRSTGEVVAPSTEEILHRLELQGLELVEIEQIGLDPELDRSDARSSESALIGTWGAKLSAAVHTRAEPLEVLQYAAQAMRHRLPLEATLRMLSEEMQSRRVRREMLRLANDLDGGADLTAALLKLQLPAGVSAMIARGIIAGRLEDVLRDLEIDAERTRQLRYNWLMQLVQPVLTLLAISFLTMFLMGFVAQSFWPFYEDFDIELNPIFEAMLFVSDVVNRYWLLLAIAGVIWFFVSSLLMRLLFRVGAIHRLIWVTPIVGPVTRQLSTARFCRALARLIEFDTPLSEALQIAGDASLNFVVQRDAYAVSRGLARGEPLVRAVRSIPDVPPRFLADLDLSAYRKVLPILLVEAAAGLESKAVRQSRVLVTLLQGFVLFFGGALVGFTLFVVFEPLLRILRQLS